MIIRKTLPMIASLLISGSLLCNNSFANTGDFKASYQSYLNAVESNDEALIITTAANAFKLGQSIYAADSLDVANLELNWANALLDKQQVSETDKAQAYKLLEQVLSLYEASYGDDAIELVEPMLSMAESSTDNKEAKDLYRRAIDIAKGFPDQNLLLADVQMTTFHRLKRTRQYDKSVSKGVLNALEIYQQKLPEDSQIRLEATFNAGLIQFANRKESKAIELFETVVNQFNALDYDHPYELAAHAKLVELYSREGLEDKSTKHCIAIGSMKPWADTQEQIALYRKPPVWPAHYAKMGKEGSVDLAFTIDEKGFVVNPEVIRIDGGRKFARSSIKALKYWRYAPKFENGKPVKAQAKVRLDFSLARK